MKKIRLMVLTAFAVVSMSAMAQEGFGSLYAQYNIASMKYSHDGHSESESLNSVSLGYNYAIPLADATPLYLELGVAGQYLFKSEDGAKLNIASAKVPLSVLYAFEVSDGITIDPFAGLYARYNVWGEEKYGDDSFNIFKKYDGEDAWAKRFQFGFQAGVRVRFNAFMIGASYTQDLSEFAKYTKINSIDLTLGVIF